ncbi:Transient receptor potential cation channel subfamily M member 2, partial [Galemys pyrenaicus]
VPSFRVDAIVELLEMDRLKQSGSLEQRLASLEEQVGPGPGHLGGGGPGARHDGHHGCCLQALRLGRAAPNASLQTLRLEASWSGGVPATDLVLSGSCCQRQLLKVSESKPCPLAREDKCVPYTGSQLGNGLCGSPGVAGPQNRAGPKVPCSVLGLDLVGGEAARSGGEDHGGRPSPGSGPRAWSGSACGSTRLFPAPQRAEEKAPELEGRSQAGDLDDTHHVNARNLTYPDPPVTRFPVPNEKVPWETEFGIYDPPFHTAEREDAVDPTGSAPELLSGIRYNTEDGPVDRRSFHGPYAVRDGLPQNPKGRTGLRGRGSLCRFGPNHTLQPVITRWRRNQDGTICRRNIKKMLEVLVVPCEPCGRWALPGGSREPGETLPWKLKQVLRREFWTSFENLLAQGAEVHKGYVDDPRNTDNAWVETVAVSVHFPDHGDVALRGLSEVGDRVCLWGAGLASSVLGTLQEHGPWPRLCSPYPKSTMARHGAGPSADARFPATPL